MSNSIQGIVHAAAADPTRSIHLVKPRDQGVVPQFKGNTTGRHGSRKLIQFPGTSELTPQTGADGSVTTLALAAAAPLALWLGHALLVTCHLL